MPSPLRGPIGAAPRSELDVPLRQEVEEILKDLEKRGEGIRVEQALKAKESVDAVTGPSPVFRPSTRTEITAAAQNLARRLKGGDPPSEADVNAALVMIMDAESQRRVLFEQKSGVRTPDPITGISSLDDPAALETLAAQTGVGEAVPRPSFAGNIRAFFDLP